jgi:hypothetical protein
MSEVQADKPAPAAAPSPRKPRSPVERAIVWGGILILLALVGVEYTGYRAQQSALTEIRGRMESGDSQGKTVRAADVKVITGREPVHVEDVTAKNLATNAKRVEVYRWFTLSPVMKRELWVYYGIGGIGEGEEPDVINVSTGEDADEYKNGPPPNNPK